MKVSFLMLSINRFEVMKDTLLKNIERVGTDVEIELLFCDNGSTDKRCIEFLDSLNPKYFRKNSKNEGVGASFSQLYLRSTGDLIVLLGNDILLPQGWLLEAMKYAEAVPRCGLIGMAWCPSHLPPCEEKFGLNAHWLTPTMNRVFGVTIIKREIIDELGFFYDGFKEYALEDSELNERVIRSGRNSFYIPNMLSEHLCNDVGQDSEYRKMKDASMKINEKIFNERVWGFMAGGDLKCQLPELKDPI